MEWGFSPIILFQGERFVLGTRASCDSGLGSPSPLASARRWGRKFSRRSELRQLKKIQKCLEELSAEHGGEVMFAYTPRGHPNLPTLLHDKVGVAMVFETRLVLTPLFSKERLFWNIYSGEKADITNVYLQMMKRNSTKICHTYFGYYKNRNYGRLILHFVEANRQEVERQ